jgi:hypothetical protein
MAIAAAPKQTLQALYRANLGILNQKLDLIQVMRDVFGESDAKERYAEQCLIVKATMGQHVRHSMDHIELAVTMSVKCIAESTKTNNNEIHYDLRERGGMDESDMDEAEARILRVQKLLQEQAMKEGNDSPLPVSAFFMLSGDGDEFELPTTIHRELGFAAHHAIHHMALVKIIAQETLHLSPDMLPLDFGKAPSTINFDNTSLESR